MQNIKIGESTNLFVDDQIEVFLFGEEVYNGRYHVLINPDAQITFLPGSVFNGYDVGGQTVHNVYDGAMELDYSNSHLTLNFSGDGFDGEWYLCD